MENEVLRRSLIQKYFTPDRYIDLLKITMMNDIDNNSKYIWIMEYLKDQDIPAQILGSGTNRCGALIEGYAFKFALDRAGKIDNRREALYTVPLHPIVIKVYESIPDGMIATSEYVQIFTIDEYMERKDEMRSMLEKIADMGFLIGDVGISTKNYVNWGIRNDGSICIMDFAYIYNTKYATFKCKCGGTLTYDKDFNFLICNSCSEKYTFGNIRRRISRQDQENEIGDIRRTGYCLTKPEQMVTYNPDLEPEWEKEKENKKSKKQIIDEIWKELKERKRQEKGYY